MIFLWKNFQIVNHFCLHFKGLIIIIFLLLILKFIFKDFMIAIITFYHFCLSLLDLVHFIITFTWILSKCFKRYFIHIYSKTYLNFYFIWEGWFFKRSMLWLLLLLLLFILGFWFFLFVIFIWSINKLRYFFRIILSVNAL